MAETVFKFLFEGGGAGGTGGAGGGASGPAGGGSAPSATRSAAQAADAGGSALGSLAKGIALAANVVQGNVGGAMSGLASLAGVGGPITGVISAFTAVVGVLHAFDDQMQENIKTLAEYSPAISASNANNEIQDEMQKMRRADQYGDQLSSYNDATGRLSRAWQDTKDDLLMPLTEIGTGIKNAGADFLEALHGKSDGDNKSVGSLLADMLPFVSELRTLREMAREQRAQTSLSRELADKDKNQNLGSWFRDLPTIESRILDRQHKGFVDGKRSSSSPKMELPS